MLNTCCPWEILACVEDAKRGGGGGGEGEKREGEKGRERLL